MVFSSQIYRILAKLIPVLLVCKSIILIIVITGCAENLDNSIAPSDDASPSEGAETLDLREANVTHVAYDISTNNFSVSLIHDDDNETGYADWWQVETLQGDLIARRVLTHRHSSTEFTRSQTIVFDDHIQWVVIRAHDQDHGYGGQAIIFNIEDQRMEKVDQGEEPFSFVTYQPGNLE